jgi:nitroreductase
MKFSDVIDKRTSIRKFSSKKVRLDKILEAIHAAIKAPFAGNFNNLQFLIIQNPNLKNKLAECCQQNFIADASFIIIICGDYDKLERMYQDRAWIYGRQHAGAAIENFLLKITDMKLASCWVGAFTEELIKKTLFIPENITIEAVLPIGYPAINIKHKAARKEGLQNVIHWDKWKVRKKPTHFKDTRTW